MRTLGRQSLLKPEGPIVRLIAYIRALRPDNWQGAAGKLFRKATREISDFAVQNNLRARDLGPQVVRLGKAKIEGLANKEYATALKDFAEAERAEIDAELARRSMADKLAKEKAEADKARADAEMARLNVINAQLVLLQKLQEIGVVPSYDADGNLIIARVEGRLNLGELSSRFTNLVCLADPKNPSVVLGKPDPPPETTPAK